MDRKKKQQLSFSIQDSVRIRVRIKILSLDLEFGSETNSFPAAVHTSNGSNARSWHNNSLPRYFTGRGEEKGSVVGACLHVCHFN